VIAVLIARRDDAMVDVYDDRPDATLPTGRPLTAEDLEAVRISTAVRGYRMDEVDALLDRLAADLRARQGLDDAPDAVHGASVVEQRRSPGERPPGPFTAPRHAAAPLAAAPLEAAPLEPAPLEAAPSEPAPFEAAPSEPEAPADARDSRLE
jgi:DivIVA domain-containing protein